ncbi:hypothetical protein O6P43_034459 [Quillaja saponaria]|uniref:Transmembrane protein n=1 Tax=Quillaja saponaria TaxID=32244 RepID=A0AAD7KNS3_QUISA|nr:hypothetical protein O6P43_034459 [Quillaja saponaria]
MNRSRVMPRFLGYVNFVVPSSMCVVFLFFQIISAVLFFVILPWNLPHAQLESHGPGNGNQFLFTPRDTTLFWAFHVASAPLVLLPRSVLVLLAGKLKLLKEQVSNSNVDQ